MTKTAARTGHHNGTGDFLSALLTVIFPPMVISTGTSLLSRLRRAVAVIPICEVVPPVPVTSNTAFTSSPSSETPDESSKLISITPGRISDASITPFFEVSPSSVPLNFKTAGSYVISIVAAESSSTFVTLTGTETDDPAAAA